MKKKANEIMENDFRFLKNSFKRETDIFLIQKLNENLEMRIEYIISILEHLDVFNDYFPRLIEFDPNILLNEWNLKTNKWYDDCEHYFHNYLIHKIRSNCENMYKSMCTASSLNNNNNNDNDIWDLVYIKIQSNEKNEIDKLSKKLTELVNQYNSIEKNYHDILKNKIIKLKVYIIIIIYRIVIFINHHQLKHIHLVKHI